MAKLPLAIEMSGLRCLVVGGGEVAARKVELLLEAGATIHVVAPHCHPRLKAYAQQNKLQLSETYFAAEHLAACRFVIAASDDAALNHKAAQLAEQRGVLVNVVDDVNHSRVFFPAILRRGDISVAISSDGNSPTLVRLLRSFIASKLPNSLATVSAQFSMWRTLLKERIRDSRLRQQVWQQISADVLTQSNWTLDEARVSAAENNVRLRRGRVYLVGAGPGDPQLLTLRAWNVLQSADVIVHDRLVSTEILALARRDAERIYVGKACAAHTLPQEKINQLLIDLAQQGKTVVRLKGGDPFIFGRGGEELLCLRAAGISVDVVPGITAALGCAASAQIPLTHRGVANRVQFLTGHGADDELPDLDWFSLKARDLTLVFYMGLKNIERVCEQLIAHGRAPETPAVIISGGTSAEQTVAHGCLATLTQLAKQAKSPSLVMVGDVCNLTPDLKSIAALNQTLLRPLRVD